MVHRAERRAFFLAGPKHRPSQPLARGDGTLLDNTVVLWANEQGNGDTHSRTEVPFVIAGNHNGNLRSGRYLTYDDASHNDLYLALAHAVGATTVSSFGNPDFVSGPLPGLP